MSGHSTTLNYMTSLKNALIPDCVDTALLPEEDRWGNYHLDTGELVRGTAFENGVLADGELIPINPRWFFTTSRPYAFPERDPGRPSLFDAWLEGRLPDPQTRRATWELMGATITQKLASMQLMVVLIGTGRSGKGTLLKLMEMLIGREAATVTFNGAQVAWPAHNSRPPHWNTRL